MNRLEFNNEEEAFQFLANNLNKKIIICSKEHSSSPKGNFQIHPTFEKEEQDESQDC